MLINLLRIMLFTLFLHNVYAMQQDPIVVNATITSQDIVFNPEIIPENKPFIIHVINQSNTPVELENSDTSVEVYAGVDKTFKIGLSSGHYKFFNDFNSKTKTAELIVATDEDMIKMENANSNHSHIKDQNIYHSTNNSLTNSQSSLTDIAFIMWRESIEALLVVGVVFSWVKQLNSGFRQGVICLAGGVAIGILWAILLGYGLIQLGRVLSGNSQDYLQAFLTLSAATMIVYMVKWMRSNGAKLKTNMQDTLTRNSSRRWNISILIVVAVAVAREGSEAVVFIYALGFGQHGTVSFSMYGAVLVGILLAVVTVYLLSLGHKIFSWRYFFKFTEILLLLLGGAMLLNCTDILVSTGLIPVLSAKVWDTSFLLSDGGHFVPLLASIIGYRATPSMVDVIVYLLYWIFALWFINHSLRIKKSQQI